MNILGRTIIAYASLLFGLAVQAQSSSVRDCSPALTREQQTINSNFQYSVSWLNIVNESNYSEKKREISGNYDGQALTASGWGILTGSVDFKDFSTRRSNFYKENKFSEQLGSSVQFALSKLDGDASRNYRSCLESVERTLLGLSYGFKARDAGTDNKSINILVGWNPEPPIGATSISIDSIVVDGKNLLEHTEKLNINQGRILSYPRTSNLELRIAVNSEAGSHMIVIPEFPKPLVDHSPPQSSRVQVDILKHCTAYSAPNSPSGEPASQSSNAWVQVGQILRAITGGNAMESKSLYCEVPLPYPTSAIDLRIGEVRVARTGNIRAIPPDHFALRIIALGQPIPESSRAAAFTHQSSRLEPALFSYRPDDIRHPAAIESVRLSPGTLLVPILIQLSDAFGSNAGLDAEIDSLEVTIVPL